MIHLRRCLIALFALTTAANAMAGETGSLLGKPITALIGPLEQYEITVSQTKDGTITVADVTRALEESELIDPTLPVVRYNDFPHIAAITLTRKDNGEQKIIIQLSGLGLYQQVPVTYVFRYKLPKGQ